MAQDLTTTNGNPLSISTLKTQLSEVIVQLQPASPDAIAARLLALKDAGLAYPPGINPQRAPDLYAFALKGTSVEALKRASKRILRGDVEGQSPNFIPTPPGFAALCRQEAVALYADSARLRETIETIELGRPAPHQKTPEEKARVRAMVDKVKEAAAALADHKRPLEPPYSIWRNKEFSRPTEPGPWEKLGALSQQGNENGEEETSRPEDHDQGREAGGSEGQQQRSESDGSVFGFEDGDQ